MDDTLAGWPSFLPLPAPPPDDATTLDALHALQKVFHEELVITREPMHPMYYTRVWAARGRNGANPWLVISDDLDKFREAIGS